MAGIQWVRGYEMVVKSGAFAFQPLADNRPSNSAFSPPEKARAVLSDRANRGVKLNNVFDMDKSNWRRKYGTTKEGDKRVELCWFFSNAPRECTRTNCQFVHKLPDAYGGKAFAEQSSTKQTELLTECQ